MKYSSLGKQAVIAMQHDVLALQAISTVYSGYLPWTNASLRPAAIQLVLNDVLLNRRRSVLELGAGLSTVFIASLMAEQGGQFVTIDHDLDWLKQVRAWMSPSQTAVTTFVHAPLVPRNYCSEVVSWFDAKPILEHLRSTPPVDLLLIDGPPAFHPKRCLNRGPALEILWPCLAASATIILDDINRPGEKQVADLWSTKIGSSFRDLTIEAGVAIWNLGHTQNTSQ